MQSKILLLVVSIVLFLASCATEALEPVMIESIQGEWIVIDAYRNNRQTRLLNKAYITITDTSFLTDIPPNQGPQKYTYQDNNITLLENNSTFKVTKLENDTLSLKTELQNFDFKLIAARKKDKS